MDVCANRNPECSERDGQRYVQSRRTRRVPEPKTFVANVSRVRKRANDPGRQAPYLQRIRQSRKRDANEGVHYAHEHRHTNPWLPA